MSDLDIDLEFLFHLGNSDSIQYIFNEEISPDIIADPLVNKIYRWQIDYYRSYHHGATKDIIEDEFSSSNVQIESPHSDIEDIVNRLRRRYGLLQGRDIIKNAASEIFDDPKDAAHKLIAAGNELRDKLAVHKDVYLSSDVDKAIRGYHEHVIKGRGPSFGFRELDDYFYGVQNLCTIVGQPKAGKTNIAIKSALQNIKENRRVAFFTLELPAKIADARLRCMAANIPFRKYLHGELDQPLLKRIENAFKSIEGVYIMEKPKPGTRTAHALYQKAIDMGSSILYIDQLQYMETKDGRALGSTNDTKCYFDVINELKDLADEGIPICLLHQFNRSAASNKDEFPDMTQIKASSSIEESSTLVLGLYANKEMRNDGIMQIGTLASRNHFDAKWNIKVNLINGYDFQMMGRVIDE